MARRNAADILADSGATGSDLFWVAWSHPQQVVEHPVLPLVDLEDPGLGFRIRSTCRRYLALGEVHRLAAQLDSYAAQALAIEVAERLLDPQPAREVLYGVSKLALRLAQAIARGRRDRLIADDLIHRSYGMGPGDGGDRLRRNMREAAAYVSDPASGASPEDGVVLGIVQYEIQAIVDAVDLRDFVDRTTSLMSNLRPLPTEVVFAREADDAEWAAERARHWAAVTLGREMEAAVLGLGRPRSTPDRI